MYIVACQKCKELKVLAGMPDDFGVARVMWTCSSCGAGQLLEIPISKDARRGDLNNIIRGFALSDSRKKKENITLFPEKTKNEAKH